MAVACGRWYTVMVAKEGRAMLVCGIGWDGVLGNGAREEEQMPVLVSWLAGMLEGARKVMVAAGDQHSAESTSEGELLSAACGSEHSAAVTEDGALYT